jgi:hypothetical protein
VEPSASPEVRAPDAAVRLTRVVRELDARTVDVLLALVLTAVGVATVISRMGETSRFRDDDLLGVTLVVLQTAPSRRVPRRAAWRPHRHEACAG